jgi:formylglycine-generating enzyme required for sulfatase activity
MVTASPNLRQRDDLTTRRLRVFEQRYGSLALDLACHAAFPLTLTTDLVYCLRENFAPECPWYGAADVLLSGLCSPIGYDLYEMEGATRDRLLRRLCQEFGEERLYTLEDFMVAYLRHRLQVEPRDRLLVLGDRPHWTALACLRSEEAVRAIEQELRRVIAGGDPKERLRLAALVERTADLLSETKFRPLLLDWANRTAEGMPIDAVAAATIAAVEAGITLKPLEFETVTLVVDDRTSSASDDELKSFEFETITVNRRGQEIRREPKQAFYFVERLLREALPAKRSTKSCVLTNQGLQVLEAAISSRNKKQQSNVQLARDSSLDRSTVSKIRDRSSAVGLSKLSDLFSALNLELEPEHWHEWQGKPSNLGNSQARQPDLPPSQQLVMVAIPGGTFWMGSPDSEPRRYSDESPQHQVTVQPFFLSQYPITQGQWRAVANTPKVKQDLNPDPSGFKGEHCPVEQVSWDDAVEFCDRLSALTGRTYRLPTEAEWEYACRAGTTTPFHFGETITTDLANYNGDYTYQDAPKGENRAQTTEVGIFPPNAFGLSDLHGNVWEWCLDHWHGNYEGAPIDGSAWLTEDDRVNRIVRGGSWFDGPWYCRSAGRSRHAPGLRDDNLGFRVVCALPRTLS